MILELDIGNSRIKWRKLDEDARSVIAEGNTEDVNELAQSLKSTQKPVMIRMCSVRGAAENEQIRQWATDTWGLEAQIAKVTRSCAGVTIQYQDPGKLGIDRWLAMLAAYERATASCVIVDGGTALTVDVLDKRGLHIGGYIVPGISLMCKSLEANTRIQLTEQSLKTTVTLGHSTDQAVRNGSLMALISLIQRVVQVMSKQDSQVKLYLTGGDADQFRANLKVNNMEVIPGLVLDGLAAACPFRP